MSVDMNKIEKKILPEYFQAIIDGKKSYELRLGDFPCHEGDQMILREWDKSKREYTGRVIEKTVTSVVKTKDLSFWNPEEIAEHGYQIISFR